MVKGNKERLMFYCHFREAADLSEDYLNGFLYLMCCLNPTPGYFLLNEDLKRVFLVRCLAYVLVLELVQVPKKELLLKNWPDLFDLFTYL